MRNFFFDSPNSIKNDNVKQDIKPDNNKEKKTIKCPDGVENCLHCEALIKYNLV